MSIVSQGSFITISAQFNDPTTTVPTDPSALQFQIIYDDAIAPVVIIGPVVLGNLTRTGVGSYNYIWNIPIDLTIGNYQVQWLAIVNGTNQFNFDQVTVVAPSTASQTAQSAMDLSNDPHILVSDQSISLKFDCTPKAVSVYNGIYKLFKVQASSYIALDYDSAVNYNDDTYDSANVFSGDPGATNVFVDSPFLAVQPSNYNSISRVLTLFFSSQLTPNAQYMLSVSGIVDVAGITVPDTEYIFSVPANVNPTVVPIETPVLIEDHSILETPFTSLDVISQLNPTFYITNTNPGTDIVFLDPSQNNGRIAITFNVSPGASFINSSYFIVQCKPLSRGFNRWSTITNTMVSLDQVLPIVYMDIPSTDATPVYNQTGAVYYQDNFKYRIKISSAINAGGQLSNNNLETDEFLGFLINPFPFLIDPDMVLPYFSEASYFEVSELIYDSSQEIQDFFDDGAFTQTITPTIRSTLEDFVLANVCCNLTRIYDFGGASNQLNVTLGDLSVSQSNTPKQKTNRSNATTWCELAGVIRNEVYNLSSTSGMKAVLRGSRHNNPMPKRNIEYQEWRNWGTDRSAEWKSYPTNWGWRNDWN